MTDILKFRHFIETEFDEEDFRTLCFDLNMDYAHLNALEQKEKTKVLFHYIEQTNKVDLFKECILREFPLRFKERTKEQTLEYKQPELIRLFLAMNHFFDLRQITQIYQEMRFRFQANISKRDAIRELLLISNLRGRIPEIKQLCVQKMPEFTLNDFSISFTGDGISGPVTSKELSAFLMGDFGEQDYRQLCFLLEIDFENIATSHWLNKDINNLSNSEKTILQESGIDFSLEKVDLQNSLRKLWVDQFIHYAEKRGKLDNAMRMCMFLNKEAH